MKLSGTHIALGIYLMAIYWSCSDHSSQTKLELIKSSNDDVTYSMSSESLNEEEGIKTIPTNIRSLDQQFEVAARSHQIVGFPCSNCHTKPVEQLVADNPFGQDAHWEIELVHAPTETMECNTCHNMQQPDQLVSLTGKSISMDHSYKQCSQCHSTQFNDWTGGAHGKSLLGWVPPRVSENCTGCHNPHNPSFESRWPARLNTVRLNQEKQ